MDANLWATMVTAVATVGTMAFTGLLAYITWRQGDLSPSVSVEQFGDTAYEITIQNPRNRPIVVFRIVPRAYHWALIGPQGETAHAYSLRLDWRMAAHAERSSGVTMQGRDGPLLGFALDVFWSPAGGAGKERCVTYRFKARSGFQKPV